MSIDPPPMSIDPPPRVYGGEKTPHEYSPPMSYIWRGGGRKDPPSVDGGSEGELRER